MLAPPLCVYQLLGKLYLFLLSEMADKDMGSGARWLWEPCLTLAWHGDGSVGAQMDQSRDLELISSMEISRGKPVCKYFLSQTSNPARCRSQSTYKHPALPSTSPCSSDADWVQQCPLVLLLTLNISSMVLPDSSFRLALFLNSSAVNCPSLPAFFFILTIN